MRRLAAGDLTARAGGLTARRRDEMAQLVRDFDTMAERLEESVNAQSRLLNDHAFTQQVQAVIGADPKVIGKYLAVAAAITVASRMRGIITARKAAP